MGKLRPRPAIRYHGAKWKLAKWIISLFPRHRIYTEAYGGSAATLIQKPRCYGEIYNDLDGEIVNLFRVIRDHGKELKEKLELTPFSRDEFYQAYDFAENPIERARRTVIKSFMGFGSNAIHKRTGFRAHSLRSGTTPSHDWKNYPQSLDFIIDRFQGVVIENKDAISVMKQNDSIDTLHYVDPPYVLSTRDKGTDYKYEMSEEDHLQLSIGLHNLEGMVVISGYQSELYRSLYPNWTIHKKPTYADGARKRVECIWMNPQAARHNHQLKIAF